MMWAQRLPWRAAEIKGMQARFDALLLDMMGDRLQQAGAGEGAAGARAGAGAGEGAEAAPDAGQPGLPPRARDILGLALSTAAAEGGRGLDLDDILSQVGGALAGGALAGWWWLAVGALAVAPVAGALAAAVAGGTVAVSGWCTGVRRGGRSCGVGLVAGWLVWW
jgi:hypothetical protein